MHSQQMFNECIARTGRVSWFRWRKISTGRTESRFFVRRTGKAAVHNIEGALTNLPAANPEKEANDIALLLLRKLLEVLKGTHFACAISQVSSSSPTNSGKRNRG